MVAMEWDVVGAELDSESFLILDGGLILVVEIIETVRFEIAVVPFLHDISRHRNLLYELY